MTQQNTRFSGFISSLPPSFARGAAFVCHCIITSPQTWPPRCTLRHRPFSPVRILVHNRCLLHRNASGRLAKSRVGSALLPPVVTIALVQDNQEIVHLAR